MTSRKTPCPICGKHPQEKFRPFCSERCKMIDLGRWFGEGYTIPDPQSLPLPDDFEDNN